MQSVFMDDLRKSLGEMTSEEPDALASYKAMVGAGNPTLAFLSVAIGHASLALMGYHSQSVLRNTPFVFFSAFKVVVAGILIGAVLWFFRSCAGYLSWKFFSSDDEESDFFAFLSVEGMSDFVYLPSLLLYIVGAFFGLGQVVIGFAMFLKCVSMYLSYPAVVDRITKLDRILCIISSFGTLIVLRGLVYIFFAV